MKVEKACPCGARLAISYSAAYSAERRDVESMVSTFDAQHLQCIPVPLSADDARDAAEMAAKAVMPDA